MLSPRTGSVMKVAGDEEAFLFYTAEVQESRAAFGSVQQQLRSVAENNKS